MDFAGTDGCTIKSCGGRTTSVTGAKSAAMSYGTCFTMLGVTVRCEVPSSPVYPSGGDFATNSAPIRRRRAEQGSPLGDVTPETCAADVS